MYTHLQVQVWTQRQTEQPKRASTSACQHFLCGQWHGHRRRGHVGIAFTLLYTCFLVGSFTKAHFSSCSIQMKPTVCAFESFIFWLGGAGTKKTDLGEGQPGGREGSRASQGDGGGTHRHSRFLRKEGHPWAAGIRTHIAQSPGTETQGRQAGTRDRQHPLPL